MGISYMDRNMRVRRCFIRGSGMVEELVYIQLRWHVLLVSAFRLARRVCLIPKNHSQAPDHMALLLNGSMPALRLPF